MRQSRIVSVADPNGTRREVQMTAQQAAFFLRLAEYRAKADPRITFHDVVADWSKRAASPTSWIV
jgi:hypothetical protein